MNPSLLSILEEQFLNKAIIVPVAERDNKGKIIPNKTVDCAGHCTFIGSNELLGYELMVVIDGQPIQVLHINNIRLRPDNRKIRQ